MALSILPALIQREQTLTRCGDPFSIILILWILGRHFLLVLILEWLIWKPVVLLLLHTTHTLAIFKPPGSVIITRNILAYKNGRNKIFYLNYAGYNK